MGKLRHAARQGPLSLPLTVLALCLAPAAQATVKFTPTVTATETYSDNVTLARDDLARGQFVSELAPGFMLEERSRRLTLSANYQMHLYKYSGDETGTNGSTSSLQANARAVMIDELLFLDASASVGQQAVSAFGQQAAGNNYASANRANVKAYQITPSLVHQFGALASGTLRLSHNSVDAGGNGLGHSTGDSLAASLVNGAAFGRVGWGLNYQRTELDDGVTGNTTTQSLMLQGSYALSSAFRLTVSAGDEKYDYGTTAGASQSGGPGNTGRSWSAGFNWAPSARTSLAATFGRRYFGKTYSLNGSHRSRNTIWTLGYNEDVTTSRGNFLSQSNVSTASIVDALFTATIPDPVARAQAVAAFILASGLPASVVNTTNYLSNRYQLQKNLQASVGLTATRSTLILSATNTKRNALSTLQADSELLGGFASALNDDVVQRGVNASASYQVSPRSTISASATTQRIESLTTGTVDHSKSVRLNLSRQFGDKLRGNVELRRVEGNLGQLIQPNGQPVGAGTYHENAVSATLSLSL